MSRTMVFSIVAAVLLVAVATATAQPGPDRGIGPRWMQDPVGPGMQQSRQWAPQQGFPGRMAQRGPGGPGPMMQGRGMTGGPGMAMRGGPGAMMPGRGRGFAQGRGRGQDIGRGFAGNRSRGGTGFGQGSRGGRGMGGPGMAMRGRGMQGGGFGQSFRNGCGMRGSGAWMSGRGMGGGFGQGFRGGRGMRGSGAWTQGRGFGQGTRGPGAWMPGTGIQGRGTQGRWSGRDQVLRNWWRGRQGLDRSGQGWPNAERLQEIKKRIQQMRERFGDRTRRDGSDNDKRQDTRRARPDGSSFQRPDDTARGRGPTAGDRDNWTPPMRRFNGPLDDDQRSQMIERWRQRRGLDQDAPGPGRGGMMWGLGRGDRSPGWRPPSDPKPQDKDPDANESNP